MEKNSKVVEALDTLQDVEASLDELLHKAATLLDAHDVALARPVDPVDLIQYARELSATTRARPGWDGRAHVMPQRYFAPTYEMNNRLMKEFRELSRGKGDTEISLSLENDNSLLRWDGVLQGPPGTPYEGGRFELKLVCTTAYPLAPPQVRFVTNVFHPNVLFKTGEICLDILKVDAWTPAWTLQSVCRAVIALLSSPEADSPLNCDAGNLIRSGDTRGFNSMARMYTQLHAMADAPRAGASQSRR